VRFCEVLSRLDGIEARPRRDEARVWRVGRTDEIEKVLSCIVDDWRDGTREEEALAAHPELYAGDHDALPIPNPHRPLPA
jgi:hypothetical protein